MLSRRETHGYFALSFSVRDRSLVRFDLLLFSTAAGLSRNPWLSCCQLPKCRRKATAPRTSSSCWGATSNSRDLPSLARKLLRTNLCDCCLDRQKLQTAAALSGVNPLISTRFIVTFNCVNESARSI